MLREDALIALPTDAWHADVRVRALERLTPAHAPRTSRIVAMALLLALHALIFALWYASRFTSPPRNPDVVQVRLIDESNLPAPALPQPVALQRSRRGSSVVATMPPTEPSSMAAALIPATPPQPELFNRDGSVRLPPATRFTGPLQAGIARGRELLARGHNRIHCRRSRFNDAPTPAQAAAAAASQAHMAHLIMGNPLDPLNDVGQGQAENAAGEHAAEMRRIEEQACDF
ncbi:MAG: hypothetical protein DYH18_12235 [Xanthomonadales bacterium PRO7]|nr:hypothetical protein [Xanthomonadales bacterium PRO7]HMM58377.1 hypothetical protein [Rudaea sp.]